MEDMEVRKINKEMLQDIELPEEQVEETDAEDGGDFGSSLIW